VTLTSFDRQLLAIIEAAVPLVRNPYAQIAQWLGCSQEMLLDVLAKLRGPDGPIREICGLFDATTLGYAQTLVAMQVPDDRLDQAGATAAGHPGVSHCYARAGKFNLWFTLAVSPGSSLGLDGTIELLTRLCRASRAAALPALRRYKLAVRFARQEPPIVRQHQPGPNHNVGEPTDEQLRAVRALQQDLPGCAEPFDVLATRFQLDPHMLLVHAADFLAAGWMRRYAAVLRHRMMGAEANLLVAWQVPHDKADHAGAICAQSPHVSHCYLRRSTDDWPFNLYTMIHGPTRPQVERVVQRLGSVLADPPRAELWTLREYAKRRVQLFTNHESQWERRWSG